MASRKTRLSALLILAVLTTITLVLPGCRPEEKKIKSDKREVEQKQEEERLITEEERRRARDLLDQAKATSEQLRLREAFDMFGEVERLDSRLAFEVKLAINSLGDRLNSYCGELIESDNPVQAPKYIGTNNDPLFKAKSILDFIILEDRFKATTKKKSGELKERCLYVKKTRDLYYQADGLIGSNKRAEGVAILKELEAKHTDTVWGVAAQDALRYLGEKQKEEWEKQ